MRPLHPLLAAPAAPASPLTINYIETNKSFSDFQEDDRVVLLGAAAETYADSHSLATSTMSKLITDEAISEWRRLTKYSATIHDVFRAR